MVTPVLEVRDLTKRYGTNLAVDGLSFKATPGRSIGSTPISMASAPTIRSTR